MKEGIVAAIVALFVVGCVWTAVQRADVGVLGARQQVVAEIARLEAKIKAGQTLTEVELAFLRQELGDTTVVLNLSPQQSTTVALESPPSGTPDGDGPSSAIDWDDMNFKAWALGVEFDRIEKEQNAYWAEISRIGGQIAGVQVALNRVKAELAR